MKITEQALFDNGWGLEDGILVKPLRENLRFWASEYTGLIHLQCYARSYDLHHVDTMEKLSQLERFLSPWLVMDTAPIDSASRAQFAEGGGND